MSDSSEGEGDPSEGKESNGGDCKSAGVGQSHEGEVFLSGCERKGEEVRVEKGVNIGAFHVSRVSSIRGDEESRSDSSMESVAKGGVGAPEFLKQACKSNPGSVGRSYPFVNLNPVRKNPLVSGDVMHVVGPVAKSSKFFCPVGVNSDCLNQKEFFQQGGGSFSGVKGFDFSSCTTLFVNNIPPSVAAYKLKAWFLNFGKVIDVFIPNKRCKVSGLCFAFVRFCLLDEALLACERADGSTFDDYVLEVNISRYPRRVSVHRSVIGTHGTSVDVCAGRPSVKNHSFAQLGAISSGGKGFKFEGSRMTAGASYAQVLLHGANAKCGPADDTGTSVLLEENSDHMQAIFNVISGRGDCDSRSSLASFIDNCMFPELHNPISGSACPTAVGDSLVEVLRASGEEAINVSDILIPLDRNDPSYHEKEAADTNRVYALLRNSPEGASDSPAQENRAEASEEEPLSKEEKAEIRSQVRYIVHDALQIGKGMGINITPRDERMIKRFAVLRQFDKTKWRMKFDDENSQD